MIVFNRKHTKFNKSNIIATIVNAPKVIKIEQKLAAVQCIGTDRMDCACRYSGQGVKSIFLVFFFFDFSAFRFHFSLIHRTVLSPKSSQTKSLLFDVYGLGHFELGRSRRWRWLTNRIHLYRSLICIPMPFPETILSASRSWNDKCHRQKDQFDDQQTHKSPNSKIFPFTFEWPLRFFPLSTDKKQLIGKNVFEKITPFVVLSADRYRNSEQFFLSSIWRKWRPLSRVETLGHRNPKIN